MCSAICDLGISRSEFLELTMYEFHALLDYHFSVKIKNEAQLMRNVIYNAGVNLMRKQGTNEIPLFVDKHEKTEQTKRDERDELFG